MLNGESALAILGGGGGGFGGSGVSALTAFRSYQRDQVGQRKAFASQPDVERRIDNFKRDIKKLDTAEDLLKDRRVLEFTLTAFGLEADVNNVGKLRAVLNSDPDDINSFANRLNDPRYAELNKFIGGEAFGLTNLQTSTGQNKVIDKYLTNRFEQSLGAQNPAVRDALFFLRRINSVDNTFDILGDLPLRSIVTNTLNLPQAIARQSVEKQAALIDRKLDLDALRGFSDSEQPLTTLEIYKADRAALAAGDKQINAALAQINTLVDQLDVLRGSYADIGNITDPAGINSAEIAVQEGAIEDLLRQQGLVSAATGAVETAGTSLDRLNQIFNQSRTAEDEDAFLALQAEFLSLADELLADDGVINGATYTDPNTGLTQNLLRSGTGGALPAGLDAVEAQISTTVDTDGTRVITNSTDVSAFLGDLQSVRDGFAAASFASVDTDLDAIEGTFDGAVDSFGDAERIIGINDSGLQYGLDQVNFATALESDNLSLAKSSVDDSLSRAEKAGQLLLDIATISAQADKPGADLADLNEKYALKLSDLNSVINDARSVSDGTTTVTFDNLLTDGTVDYLALDLAGGANDALVRAEGYDFDASIFNNLPATLDGTNGEALRDTVLDTYKPAVDGAVTSLTRDAALLDFAANQLDPRGALDAGIRTLSSELGSIIDKAKTDGVNLLSEFGSDSKISLQNSGTVLTIDAQNGFEPGFLAALEAIETTILTGGSDADRITAVNDALFLAQSVQSRLTGEQYALDIQQGIVNENITLIEEETAEGDFFKPIEYTSEALKFIEKYLIQKDLEGQGLGSSGSFNQNAGLVQLFAQAGGSTNLLA